MNNSNLDDCGTVLTPEFWRLVAVARDNREEFPFGGMLAELEVAYRHDEKVDWPRG